MPVLRIIRLRLVVVYMLVTSLYSFVYRRATRWNLSLVFNIAYIQDRSRKCAGSVSTRLVRFLVIAAPRPSDLRDLAQCQAGHLGGRFFAATRFSCAKPIVARDRNATRPKPIWKTPSGKKARTHSRVPAQRGMISSKYPAHHAGIPAGNTQDRCQQDEMCRGCKACLMRPWPRAVQPYAPPNAKLCLH